MTYTETIKELIIRTKRAKKTTIYLCHIFSQIIDPYFRINNISPKVEHEYPQFNEFILKTGIKLNPNFKEGDAWCANILINPEDDDLTCNCLGEIYELISTKDKIEILTNYLKTL